MKPEPRVERLITLQERRDHSPMTGADWRGSMRYSLTAAEFAIRDLSRALGWRRFVRRVIYVLERLGRAVAS